ncbi:unnamed protein product [Fraxinus pennsylvanica]|uniref:Adaptor-related protein complex 5 beta subunit n=1 Tax=Fraxinus pennsylvanica TaxID=56036 RepID=A0AAD2E4A1_9LAMI|nr:unnamed protein product [Fraxinus pennsylvanica]
MTSTPVKPLSPQEWEALIDDYNNGGGHLHRSVPVLELCLSSVLRKDLPLPLKLHILTFLEQHSFSLFPADSSSFSFFFRLFESLRFVVQSPTDPFSFKDQFLISTTSIFILLLNVDNNDLNNSPLNVLVELLLTIINRPNHGLDRQTRGVACECLRQLELAFPCLLSEITPHLWALCQSERTHVAQSYVLLLSTLVYNIVKLKPPDSNIISISNATTPLIPFNVPRFLIDRDEHSGGDFVWKEEISYKDLRRVIAFLLEWPPNLTPFGLLEFMTTTIPVVEELELQASLLRVQFSGLLYTYDPLLCHAFLEMYSKFLDSFDGQDLDVANRLLLMTKESQHHLVFRLLGLHWLLGFIVLLVNKDLGKKRSILEISLSFYPTLFDSLSLKALKLDLLAYCSVLSNSGDANAVKDVEGGMEVFEVKLFEDGLVAMSAFKWLPPWSTETAVVFRTFHKFLIGASPHSDTDSSSGRSVMESNVFHTLQRMLVDSTSEYQGLVSVILAFVNRLLGCHKHRWLGDKLVETLDEHLLQKLKIDYRLGSYFPLFEIIAENNKVSPIGLLEILMKFLLFLVERHGPDTGLKSWGLGSKVLSVCRTMLIHHHSSGLFLGLSHLLAFTCLHFPDLEVRDNSRFYLRMLVCIPGKKLKHILHTGEQLPGMSPSTNSNSFFSLQSPRSSYDLKKSHNIASYIHVERLMPLLVKQSWSLPLSNLGISCSKPSYLEGGIRDNEPASTEETEIGTSTSTDIITKTDETHQQQEPLRVMDSKISEMVRVLRRHFSFIPDYRHMPGLKIKILCSLRFDSEAFSHEWAVNMLPCNKVEDALPAIYATVLNFTSSAPYGSMPSYLVPFLVGQPPKNDCLLGETCNSLEIIMPAENGCGEGKNSFEAPVVIQLEPREPMPGLVDVFIETNAENGQIIRGQLHSISVGIEDMFLKAIIPEDIEGEAVPRYHLDLFNALWEACGTPSSITGRETFVLRGGKGIAAINGTRSVKLLQVPVTYLIQAVERNLTPFVVCVIGEALVDMVKAGGIMKDIVWKDKDDDDAIKTCSPTGGPLYLKYFDDDNENQNPPITRKTVAGYLDILIFLPPRFHLLFQMEVGEVSTLVHIRTDHWPCLAYVDDYLEALFLDSP